MKEETRHWLGQSKADNRTAQHSMKAKDYYASAFWSQQTAEKALKAVIIEKEGELIRIHDLVILGKKAGLPQQLIEKCEILSKVYIESRYDTVYEKIPSKKFYKKDALRFHSIAKEVLEWVKKTLK